jgi:hypothetical protein
MSEPSRRSEWLQGFVLPLVAGGDVRVKGVLGPRALDELLRERPPAEIELRIAEARYAIAAELACAAPLPELDQEALTLAVAVSNLLFLSHPQVHGPLIRLARLAEVAAWSAERVLELPAPETPGEHLARHTILHHLFDLGRDDVRVSFWAGRREFRGAEPPPRLLKWQTVRRVREERWRVNAMSEAASDKEQRKIMLALLDASPLSDLLHPIRLEPPLDLAARAPLLGEPQLARAIADRYLQLGFAQLGAPLVGALLALYGAKRSLAAARLWTRFLAHLHLLWLLGRAPSDRGSELSALAAGQPASRDFFGLFAAAQRVGLGRPDDVALEKSLERRVDAYVDACTNLCGPARVEELTAIVERAVTAQATATG